MFLLEIKCPRQLSPFSDRKASDTDRLHADVVSSGLEMCGALLWRCLQRCLAE